MTLKLDCKTCGEEVEVAADQTLHPDLPLPGHVCACWWCGHPRDRHPKSEDGTGIRCTGAHTNGSDPLCSDCKELTKQFHDPDTLPGALWFEFYEKAANIYIPGLLSMSEWNWSDIRGRAQRWADSQTADVLKILREKGVVIDG